MILSEFKVSGTRRAMRENEEKKKKQISFDIQRKCTATSQTIIFNYKKKKEKYDLSCKVYVLREHYDTAR